MKRDCLWPDNLQTALLSGGAEKSAAEMRKTTTRVGRRCKNVYQKL